MNGVAGPARSPMTIWGPMLTDFTTHLQAANRSPRTIRLYRYRLLDLADVAPRPDRITEQTLINFVARPGWAPETRKTVRTAFRAFFGWAHRTGRLPTDPSALLPTISVPAGEPRPTPEIAVRRSLRAADQREQFMILLGAYAGLRCMEIAAVHASSWDGHQLRVAGKGGKTRCVPVRRAELVDLLDDLDGYAFPNRWTGMPITPGHVSKLLSRALEQTWTGHTLRHRFGTVACDATKDVLAVGQVMGHSRPETTQRYCRVSADRLEAVAAAAAA